MPAAEDCPCGSGVAYAGCCGRWHDGAPAPTPQALMRARYSAYVRGLERFLLDTWHPSTRPATLGAPDDPPTRWLGLEVRRETPPAVEAGTGVECGFVEFVARYRVGGRGQRMHEVSRFIREDGRWYYVDGQFPAAAARIPRARAQ